MGVAGSGVPPYVLFRQALEAGDLARVRALAASMPRINLRDALEICLLMRDQPEFQRAAYRWVGRLVLEAPAMTFDDIRAAADAIEQLPDAPDDAMESLAAVCRRCGIR